MKNGKIPFYKKTKLQKKTYKIQESIKKIDEQANAFRKKLLEDTQSLGTEQSSET
jgi:hypothetical protein